MVKPVTSAPRARSSPGAPIRAFGRSLGDFGKLSPAEKKLLDCCRRGVDSVIAEETPEEETEANRVRATIVRFLALGGDEQAPVHEYGISLKGAWLTGVLDFSSAQLQRELALSHCRIEGIDAWRSSIKSLSLDGSSLEGPLRGEELRSDAVIAMCAGFHAARGVDLTGATIGGNLMCGGGRFIGAEEPALCFDRAEIAGNVFLNDGFHATGEVQLLAARIGGYVAASEGHFENGKGIALNCGSARVGGSIFLISGFCAQGEVNLYGATVGGLLVGSGGRMENEEGIALGGGSAVISKGVTLGDGFHAVGEVSFAGAEIGGNLDCSGGHFENPQESALTCDDARISRSVLLGPGFQANGATLFRRARIGGNFECMTGRLRKAGSGLMGEYLRTANPMAETMFLEALSLDRASVAGNVDLIEFSCHGVVSMFGAVIGGTLDCEGDFESEEGRALVFPLASISGDVRLGSGFHATALVLLSGATIRGDLDCGGGRFEGARGVALDFDDASVSGHVLLHDGFHASGEVRLANASIGRSLRCDGGSFESRSGAALTCSLARVSGGFFFSNVASLDGTIDLSAMYVGTLCDDVESWSGARGQLILDGFAYERLARSAPTDARSRIQWLDGQSCPHLVAEFRPQPWEQLIAVLRAMGHPNEARKVAIARQHRLRRAGKVMWGARTLHLLYGVFVGYGYRPARLLSAVLAVWLVCGAAYWAAANPRWFGPAPLIAPTGPASGGIESFSPWVYSADVLLPVVDLGYSEAWMPVLTEPGGNGPSLWGLRLRGLRWLEIALGWLFGGALVAMLGSLVKRD